MIEIKNIEKSFDGISIIKDISTSFEKGKTNLIIGQSGSGKTVLIKCMIGLHEVDSGRVTYDGRIFSDMKSRKKVGNKKIALGTDYPFPLGEIEPGKLIDDMNYSQEMRDRFFYKNALEWLGLSEARFK